MSYSAIVAMGDDELVRMLEGVKIEPSERYQDLSERFEYIVKELKRTGVSLDLLWRFAGAPFWIACITITTDRRRSGWKKSPSRASA